MLSTEVVNPSTLAIPKPISWHVAPQPKTVLVTGAAGSFGHHFVEHVLVNTSWNIVALVRLSKIGSLERLTDPPITWQAWQEGRMRTVWHDFNSPIPPHVHASIGPVDYIVHAGAETHVDRSITDPGAFVTANVVGTFNMLEYAREYQPDLTWFEYFSTDEVYGPAPIGVNFPEDAPINATNPYSATKAGAEALVNAYGNTYSLPVFITNTMNLIGERQGNEKFLSIIMNKVLDGELITIHADPTRTKSGSRFYLHCRNAAEAIVFLLRNAKQRERYNVVGDTEVSNLELAELVREYMARWGLAHGQLIPELNYEMVDFHSSRPGHDLRYALDGSKLKNMGFKYPLTFEESLKRTVEWSLTHPKWLGR
ncbi:MAG: dTDP-glucose 4,6-dehydratase [Candidatus Thorarchaeota archaeon]|jgi:dTDP-glucose 4,6-dehydratase